MQKNTLKGKKILFVGDSIVSGCRDDENGGVWKNSCDVEDGRGWPRRLKLEYGADTDNVAIGGESLVKRENRGHILAQLQRAKYPSYDYVILEGGYNDAIEIYRDESGELVWNMGEVAPDFRKESFEETSVLGALETLFFCAKAAYPDAVFGYVIPYDTPRSTYGGITANREKMTAFWEKILSVCEKWRVPVLNLFSGTTQDGIAYSTLLATDTTQCLPGNGDFTHLTSHGYDVITPYIEKWPKNL